MGWIGLLFPVEKVTRFFESMLECEYSWCEKVNDASRVGKQIYNKNGQHDTNYTFES
tara:strand:+ start:1003 stop:1173 length:171 start_codon:yes stop_codon:yes gene_type:complete